LIAPGQAAIAASRVAAYADIAIGGMVFQGT